MGLITKQEVQACDSKNSKPVKVPTPAWGKEGDKDPHVYVRKLSAKEMIVLSEKEPDGDDVVDKFQNAVRLVAASLCDKDKNPIADDSWIDILSNGDYKPMNDCLLEINKLNGTHKDSDSGN